MDTWVNDKKQKLAYNSYAKIEHDKSMPSLKRLERLERLEGFLIQ
ncbi:hypothetical protein AO375_1515 [Moraxella catarrhalis]|nr:hypothetical protein AO375_1515 [Moraxella catarrhalis]OAV24224.1 hypothetical protein AO369_1843 [Moraxella catarrhalis]